MKELIDTVVDALDGIAERSSQIRSDCCPKCDNKNIIKIYSTEPSRYVQEETIIIDDVKRDYYTCPICHWNWCLEYELTNINIMETK